MILFIFLNIYNIFKNILFSNANCFFFFHDINATKKKKIGNKKNKTK